MFSFFSKKHPSIADEKPINPDHVQESWDDCVPDPPKDCTIRTEFGTINCHATAYPSQGGIVTRSFTGLELDWLGLSRLQPAKTSSDPHEEDEFAYQMLRLGARWWRSEAYERKKDDEAWSGIPYPEYPPILYVGYPSTGGVWVLKRYSMESEYEEQAKAIMAFTMDERCAVLKEFGAQFYASVEDCPDIPKSLEEGIAVGKRYEEVMNKIGRGSGLE